MIDFYLKKGYSLEWIEARIKAIINRKKLTNTYKGVRVKSAMTINIKGLAALTSSFFATIKILFSNVQVVHYHAEGPCIWLWIIRFFSNKKIIATINKDTVKTPDEADRKSTRLNSSHT